MSTINVQLWCKGKCVNDFFPVLAVPRIGETVTSDALPRFNFLRSLSVCGVEHDSTGVEPVIRVWLKPVIIPTKD